MAKIPGVHVPPEVKNLAINGALDYWQRVEANTTTVNTATSSSNYTADMVAYNSGGSTVKNYSIVQSSNIPTVAQSGFDSTYSYLFTMITGISSFAASDYVIPWVYKMEGFDVQRIFSKNATFGFWVYASVVGTYSFALQTGVASRSYVTTFSVTSANTWQYVTITAPVDSVANIASWSFGNVNSLQVLIGQYAGTTYQTSTTGSWQAANVFVASGATNWMATSGAILQIAQFSIAESALGLGTTGFQRAGKTVQQELTMCQRYYEKSYAQGTALGTATRTSGKFWNGNGTTGQEQTSVYFSVAKRAAPSMTIYSVNSGSSGVRYNLTTAADESAGYTDIGPTQACSSGNSTVQDIFGAHWAADAGL